MDWSEKISLFTAIQIDQVANFAPAGEMEQAIIAYNNAIGRLQSNSQDTALIALRKLAASYPSFARPAFLLGCCLGKNDQPEEARKYVAQALAAGLPPDLEAAALACQEYLQELPEQLEQKVTVPASSAVLEKVRRRGKVRLAGKKERLAVLRGRDPGQERQVKIKTPFDPSLLLPAGLVALALILLVTTVLLAIGYFKAKTKSGAAEQLAWLVSQLEELSGRDQAAADLIDRYAAEFSGQTTITTELTPASSSPAITKPSPEPEPSRPATAAPTPSPTPAPTATPAPTPVPTPDPTVLILQEAVSHYENALASGKSDEAASAVLLVKALQLVEQIPAGTLLPDQDLTGGQLKEQVETQIAAIKKTAPGKLRLLADKEFNQERYEAALALYLPAYVIDPRSRNGGVAYYVGRCYQELGDFNSARPYYEYVVKTFANRDIAKSAAWRLSQMAGST